MLFHLKKWHPRMKTSEVVHENEKLETIAAKSTSDSESDTTKIIDFSLHFNPYKSIMERVILEEVSAIAKEDEEFKRKKKDFSSNTVEVG
uniref:Uncharacterized protein n=1 Tax=Lactuca sativa TaxID=4236 RepID=A0A9R1W3L3_LACSA|nr:hypothetical protein LSAT_V11C300137970 [Lactuca sativa]